MDSRRRGCRRCIKTHDNEDHNNKNHIVNNGGLTSTGISRFDKNTEFYWRFSNNPTYTLTGFGVLSKPEQGPVLPHQLFMMMKTEKMRILQPYGCIELKKIQEDYLQQVQQLVAN